ncbi:unnamed protein product [Fusarium equiseti]|uniref:Uncharacterized protein n=1 Tax=Fusarium equiseti TaxID=61235 RepID=A0A8J2IRI4_FUSEQ|nr:unnamed protein product [Fusarium equiseti]
MDQRNDLDVNDEVENIETLDSSNTIISEGTVLENDWVVGKQTGSTEHANIYCVTHKVHDDDSDITYEARSYDFDRISPQVKSNRARAIRRLSRRTVLSTTWNGLRVVIYRTGAVVQEKKEKMESLQGDIVVADSACKRHRQKTTRQQESDRLRQISRRRRVKQEKVNAMSKDDQQLPDYQGPEAPKVESMQPVKVDPNEFFYFHTLYLANGDETIRRQVPVGIRSQVEDYLAAIGEEVEIDGEEALLEFIAIKEREIVFLQRTNNKFKPILKNWSEYLDYVTSQILREFGVGSGKQQNHDVKNLPVFRTRYKLLSAGMDALPSLILEAEELVQKLQLRLLDVRQTKETLEIKQGVKLEKKRLGKQIRNLQKWAKYVTVGSSSYYKIMEDIISAEKQLKMLESSIEE